MTIDTHIHADHSTSASMLRREVGSRIAPPALDALSCTEMPMEDGDPLPVGGVVIGPMHPPGHTANHLARVMHERVFARNALLSDGCGRTAFQRRDARATSAVRHIGVRGNDAQ